MYVFKSLSNDDVIVSPKELNHNHQLNVGDFPKEDIQRLRGKKGTSLYNSIKHLYYSNYLQGKFGQVSLSQMGNEDTPPTNFDNYLATTLNPQRNFPKDNSDIGVISVPSIMYGDHIKPHSVMIKTTNLLLTDDGDGIINMHKNDKKLPVGNVIYEHGMIILCPLYNRPVNPGEENSAYYSMGEYGLSKYGVMIDTETYSFTEADLAEVIEGGTIDFNFSSSYIAQESLYRCSLGSNEFNSSQNPTLRIDPKYGELKDFAVGNFTPYVTAVGLYNEQNELMAVAKLGKPLPTSNITDMDIVIKIDRL